MVSFDWLYLSIALFIHFWDRAIFTHFPIPTMWKSGMERNEKAYTASTSRRERHNEQKQFNFLVNELWTRKYWILSIWGVIWWYVVLLIEFITIKSKELTVDGCRHTEDRACLFKSGRTEPICTTDNSELSPDYGRLCLPFSRKFNYPFLFFKSLRWTTKCQWVARGKEKESWTNGIEISPPYFPSNIIF